MEKASTLTPWTFISSWESEAKKTIAAFFCCWRPMTASTASKSATASKRSLMMPAQAERRAAGAADPSQKQRRWQCDFLAFRWVDYPIFVSRTRLRRTRTPGRRVGGKRPVVVLARDDGQLRPGIARQLGWRLGRGWVRRRIRWLGRRGIWRVWRREQRGRGSVRRLVKPGPGLRNEAKMLSTDTKLTELVKRLKEFAASNLECGILFGSAAS